VELRDRWGSRASFIMAAIGSAVGLGNLWRFPYVCYANGGGAFLIPYFVALMTAGIPLMILEYGLGIRMQGSAPKSLAKLNRRWEFVGWWALIIGMIISMYYVMIMGVSGVYLVNSFSAQLPWGTTADSAGGFFNQQVLQKSGGPFQLGGMAWGVLIAALITWLVIFLIIFKGVKQVGKVVMVTVPLPWLMILVLMVRGFTLPGAAEGLNFYLAPNWAKLLEPSTWMAAYGQIFFSLSLGFGIMIAYASYMSRTSDVTNNAFITSFANCATSYLAGFAVFSILGYFAVAANLPVERVVGGGPGLAFVVYPAALAKLGDVASWMAPLFSVVFFVALLTLGIDSAFSIVEAFASGVQDKFGWSKTKTAAVLCIIGAVGTLWFCTKAGIHWLDITDHWVSESYGLAVIGLLECLLVGWFYKLSKLREEINAISEVRLGRWWDFFVKFLTPAILIVILIQVTLDNVAPPRAQFGQTCPHCGKTYVYATYPPRDAAKLFLNLKGEVRNEVAAALKRKIDNPNAGDAEIIAALKRNPQLFDLSLVKKVADASMKEFCPYCKAQGRFARLQRYESYRNKKCLDYPPLAVFLGGWLWVVAAPLIGLLLAKMSGRKDWLEAS